VTDTGVFIQRAEGETVSIPVDGITSIHRSTESIPSPQVTVTRDRRANELRDLENLRAGNQRLNHDNEELRQRVRELERELANAPDAQTN